MYCFYCIETRPLRNDVPYLDQMIRRNTQYILFEPPKSLIAALARNIKSKVVTAVLDRLKSN